VTVDANRTCNRPITKLTPYPLGHQALAQYALINLIIRRNETVIMASAVCLQSLRVLLKWRTYGKAQQASSVVN